MGSNTLGHKVGLYRLEIRSLMLTLYLM